MAKPYRNKKWLAFIRSLPCAVTGVRRGVEACHTGPHGVGQKAPDDTAIPLIRELHRTGNFALDKIGRVRFEDRYQISIAAILDRLTSKPFIRVEGSLFVADYLGETYTLLPRAKGLTAAIGRAAALRRRVLEESFPGGNRETLRRVS